MPTFVDEPLNHNLVDIREDGNEIRPQVNRWYSLPTLIEVFILVYHDCM